MMKYKTFIIFFFGIFFVKLTFLYAHGVVAKIDDGGILVSATYDTGEAMSYAKATISAPGAELAFQSGRTDRNGRFCFFPDIPGDWIVVVDDEIGHRLEVRVQINEAMTLRSDLENGSTGQGSLSRPEKVIVGIAVIFGISGILFWWKGRK